MALNYFMLNVLSFPEVDFLEFSLVSKYDHFTHVNFCSMGTVINKQIL